jgi:hypothetical protein
MSNVWYPSEFRLGQLVKTRNGIGRVIREDTSAWAVNHFGCYRYEVLIGGTSEARWYPAKQLREVARG